MLPLYEYECQECGRYEVLLNATDTHDVCLKCGRPVTRVPSTFAVHYKGPGFYTTDNRSALDAFDEQIIEEVPE